MEKWFTASSTSLIAICITALGIYVTVIIFTRLAGKRSFSKMSSFDFAMTVAVGSIIATTVLSSSVSLLEGVVGLAAVYILQFLAALSRRLKIFQKIIDNEPLLLMKGEEILHENLRKAHVTEADLRSKLREANVLQLSQVKAVIFETTGDISVLHSENMEEFIDQWILKDVQE